MKTLAHDLLEALGLALEKGSATRYPATQVGPAEGYRFWATHARGTLQFGTQVEGRLELNDQARTDLMYFGFRTRPNEREVVIELPPTLASALPIARIAMATLEAALNL